MGPKTGARMIGTPIALITRGRLRGPAARTRIIWPIGISMPPPRPCRTRAPISDWADQAKPQRAEPAVKRIREMMYRRLAPKRAAAQPVTGITAASASM